MVNRLLSTLAVPFKIMNSDLLRTATDYTMSINGNAVSAKNDDAQWQFVYVPETSIISVLPLFGPRAGKNILTVTGAGIPVSSSNIVNCIFEVTGMPAFTTPSINVSSRI